MFEEAGRLCAAHLEGGVWSQGWVGELGGGGGGGGVGRTLSG